MKKIMLLLLTIMLFVPTMVKAKVVDTNNRVEVTLENCSTVSNIWVKVDKKTRRIGLLAFDTDSTELNTEINNYVSSKLKNASLIEIEYDDKQTDKDDYNRDLVWVYVDGVLLQDDLISKGYGKVNYINDEYSYLKKLCTSERKAIESKKGIWQFDAKETFCDNNYTNESDLEAKINVKEKEFDQSLLNKLTIISIFMLGLLLALKGKRIYEKKQ